MNRVLESKDYKITQHSTFYSNKDNVVTGNKHNGVDIHAIPENGDYIIAHSDGVIEWVENNHNTTDTTGGSLGNYVGIRHANGYMTLYCHLAPNSICVSIGQEVKKGQRIGYMGQTGRATGVHLHFEVRKPGNIRIMPEEYLDNDLPDLPTNAQNNENIVQNTPEKEPECTVTDTFEIGDKVFPIELKDYNGKSVIAYRKEYTITEITRDRVVLSTENGVWGAFNINNLKLTQKSDDKPEKTDDFQIGDKVLVLSGVATETPYGEGNKTAEYHGKPEENDVKYITNINKGTPRPYHVSNEPLNGRPIEETHPRGWVSADQIQKI